MLSNTDISSNELEEYLNLKFNEGVNYNYSLNKLAQNKNTYALYELGINEYKGYIKGYPRYDISYKYFEEASKKNHPGSYYMLSKMHYNKLIGASTNEELKLAYDYLIKAINLGNIPALNTLGLLYLNGTYPLIKDLDKATEYLSTSADHNHLPSEVLLLYLYTEEYLKDKSTITLNKINDLVKQIELHPEYNNHIKKEIETTLKKIKEDNIINLDIILSS